MKFYELAIGDKFTMDRVGQCEKVSLTEYRRPDGGIRRTSGTAIVNGPHGDRARAQTVKAQQERLNAIAAACNLRNWYELERRALAGDRIVINE